ncbi:uncharacterized protein L201_000332 [Kwoniella dendrophila CBS 6074]|uniref:Bromo domain-containing protein n=1 Tax=Kwoniella dendrophila CBS 6074 TaxID=1295534 RepID=A0AAX4JM44_9TREE
MSPSLPNNHPASSIPYSYIPYQQYPQQPSTGQPPQSGYPPNFKSDYSVQPHIQGIPTHNFNHPTSQIGNFISGGEPSSIPNNQNYYPHPHQHPVVNNEYNIPQPTYSGAYSQSSQPVYSFSQPYPIQQSYSHTPQLQNIPSPAEPSRYHQPPSQLSVSPSASASPAFNHLLPQADNQSSPRRDQFDPALSWQQPVQQQQQQQQQQSQFLISHHLSPAVTPTITSSTPPAKSPIKIRLKVGSKPPGENTNMTGRTRHAAIVEQEESYGGRPRRGASQRAQAQMVSYKEDDDDFEDAEGEDDAEGEEDDEPEDGKFKPELPIAPIRPTRSGRTSKAPERYGNEDDFEDKLMPSSPPEVVEPRRSSGRVRKIVVDPDEDEEEFRPTPATRNAVPTRATRSSLGSVHAVEPPAAGPSYTNGNIKPPKRNTRQSSKVRHSSADAEDFQPTDDGSVTDENASSDQFGNFEDEEEEDDDLQSRSSHGSYGRKKSRSSRRATRSMPTRRTTRSAKRADPDSDDEYGARPNEKRNLRIRTSKPNYQLPTLDDLSKEISMQEAMAAASRPNGRPRGVGGLSTGVRFGASAGSKGLPWSVKGKDLAQAMGDPDTSDSDDFATPLKSGAAGPSMSGAAPGTAQRTNAVGPSDVPNYGRINPKSNMADADPLGIDMNVTFDNVGGLDDHINQLKEMVALPLLYPELFQQFGITPPRGVLFHGPPGTGKTLLARALAASCGTGNTKIAFFMRKGADVLSKWVGEAERQLRMLFEEARACQPSIIFFDEIDGIAPVRSSKQDQIHASLVSTLLALMDGMDGRGQVIVIGATNRPDAVDPALRRPGRFDREFYFPLPNRAARKKIIQINTRKWDPQLSDEFTDKLAQLTKGYGGADLRALCTETALNAIQRRYPQIYKTADRLQLETKSIHVSAKDFMMSIKKIVPSSARSTSSAAVQLPSHLVPLLSAPLERIRKAIDHVLPPRKNPTALEEAEYEDEEGDSFEKHMMLQSLDKLRTFKPRILIYGEAGMGQAYLGPAILHHLEGFHVQSFDLGTLLGDSTRSIEAAVVQLIVEAKRHQPSIIFVPALSAWSATINDTARATVRTLLDGIAPSDPILVLGVSDAPIDELPGDVRGLFGFGPENRIALETPTRSERTAYFADLFAALHRPPTEFPDGMPRKKRVFEVLPLAAPLPPRQPTAAELLREEEKDQAARDMIFQSFVHLVRDFLKRHRKVIASVKDDAMAYSNYLAEQAAVAVAPATEPEVVETEVAAIIPTADGDVAMAIDPSIPPAIVVDGEPPIDAPVTDGTVITVETVTLPVSAPPAASSEPVWQAHPIDIDTLQYKLLKHKYYTPADFLADISKIEENASKLNDPERLSRVQEMASSARYHVQGFDQKWIPEFERYKERMLAKKAEKQKKKEAEAAAAANKEDGNLGGNANDIVPIDGNGVASNPTTQNHIHTNGFSTESGSSLKRPREGDEDEIDGSGDIQGREKRSKDQEQIEMEIDDSARIANPITVTSNGQPSPPPAAPSVISTIPSVPSPNKKSNTTLIDHPQFIIPEEDLRGLRSDLDLISSTFNIDQLEQLRASLFDIIWRGRTEWNRKEMIEHMRKRISEWGQEVEKWIDGGKW